MFFLGKCLDNCIMCRTCNCVVHMLAFEYYHYLHDMCNTKSWKEVTLSSQTFLILYQTSRCHIFLPIPLTHLANY